MRQKTRRIHPSLLVETIEQAPADYLSSCGEIFASFDECSQDSGNVSFGFMVENRRYFIKTAGNPGDPRPYLPHVERVNWLHNAVRLSRSCQHPLLPHLRHMIQSPWGPVLVYDWVDGEQIRAPRSQREDPQSAFQRFRRLPAGRILDVLDQVYGLHDQLARLGWIAVDFYDGCLIYDFENQTPFLVDLDMYRQGPFRNEMGRMFGSTRFMSPEEFRLDALIDQRSNVFTLGRTALVLLSDGTLVRRSFRGSDALYEVTLRACAEAPAKRYPSLAEFYQAWCAARSG